MEDGGGEKRTGWKSSWGEIDVDGGDGGRKSEWIGGSSQTLLAILL